MPTVNWGIDSEVIDEFDRDAQYTPYTGPKPPAGTYCFTVKNLKHVAGADEKWPQLWIGLELEPRTRDEMRYAGFYIMKFATIAPPNEGKKGTAFQYVPFLDAIGVTSEDFTRRTRSDEEGKISRIGPWKNEGETIVLAEIQIKPHYQTGQPQLEVGWIGDASAVEFDADLEEAAEEIEYAEDEEEFYEEEDE